MELSALKFVADTTELERASKVIAGLVTDVSKLDKVSRDAAQTEAILAKAAKSNADANLQNAKAQDVRLKSTITADKADKANEQSVAKKTKAVESHTQATKENVSILQRQQDIYNYQTQGFSKGQAGILANAKATGQWSKELEDVLELQRQFSTNTFDKSETGLKRMVKASKEASAAQGFLNEGYNLTSKQAKELSNDLDRQSASLKQQGKSYQEITKAQEVYKQNFVKEAVALNKSSDALEVVEKQRRDAVSATNYLTQADQKMAAALNTSNAAFDKGGTDSLVRYESALRKSGLAQEVVTKKLATYRTQLSQVQAQEQKRSEQYLARAASPQLTDLAVSLYSGQAPLTVLLQQGGQLADQLRLSGVEAARFSAILKESFYSMVPVIKQVGVGLAGLVSGMFIDAGKGITNFVGNITGITLAMESTKRMIASGGEENFKYIASLQKIGSVASTVTAAGLAAVLLVLVAMAVEYKKIVQAEGELSKALATSGGALGISKDQAMAYAEGMQTLGIGTLKAAGAITEIAKAGKIGKDSLELVTKAAVDMEKTAGVSIEETAKQYAKLQDEPTKGLLEIAEKTGLVDRATLDYVASLEQQGDKTESARVATLALGSVHAQVAGEIKDNWSPIETLWNDIKTAIGNVKQEIYNLTTSNEVVAGLRTVWETVAVVVSEVWFTIKGVGKEIGGIGAQIGAVMSGNFAQAAEIGNQMKIDAASAAEEQKKYVASLLNRGKQEEKNFNQSKEQNSQYAAWSRENAKALEKTISKDQQYANKQKQLRNDVNNGLIDEIKYNEALAGWKKIIYGAEKKAKPDRQGNKDLETEIDLRNKALGLLGSFNNELDSIERLRAKSGDEDQYQKSLNALIEKQPIYLERQKEINAAHELSNKLMGKSEGLGKDYYKTLEQIQKFQDEGLYSPEKADALRQAAFDATQLAKEQLKYIEDSTKAYTKYSEEAQKSLDSSVMENKNLDDRLAMLGLTNEEQKKLKIQQQARNALLGVDLRLTAQIAKIWNDVREGKIDPFSAMQAQLDAERAAGEERKLINKEVAVQASEDFDAEFRKIKEGVTDSIVTALFEGGKAGSKKLRDVLVSVLRQKVTMVVDVGVNAFMNSMIGGFFGGGGAAGGTGGAMSMLSNGFSLYNAGSQALTLGSQYLSGTMSGSNVLGSVFANATGTGIDGLLATNGAFGTAPGAAGGAGGAGMAGAGAFAAVAAVVLNALGAFKSERKVAGGLSGTLGKGNINAWEEWREGGTLFSGPNYDTINPVAELDKAREKLAKARESGDLRNVALQEMLVNNLEDTYGGLAEATMKQSKVIQSAFDTMRNSAASMADVLGVSSEKAKNFTTLLGGEKGLNFEGLSAQEQQGKLAEALATANNELAQQILGTWEDTSKEVSKTIITGFGHGEESAVAQSWETLTETIKGTRYVASEYAKEGEKAIDTLTRLATSLATVKDLWADMRVDFDATGLAGADAASKIADAFGGLEAMTQQFSSYIGNYYSETEKKENLARRASEAFSRVGLSFSSDDILKATKPLMIGFVEGVLSEFGPSSPQYVAAIQQANLLAGLYPDVTDTVSGLSDAMERLKDETSKLEIDLLRAQGNTSGAEAAQRVIDTKGLSESEIAIYDYNQALKLQISTLEDATKAAKSISDAYSKEVTRLEGLLKSLESAADSLSKFKKELTQGALSTLTPVQKYEQSKVDYQLLLQKALTGDVQAANDFSTYASKFLENSRTVSASGGAYTTDYQKVMDDLNQISGIVGNKVSETSELIRVSKSQVDYLAGIDTSLKSLETLLAEFTSNLTSQYGSGISNDVLAAYSSIGRTGFGAGSNQIDVQGFEYWLKDLQTNGSTGFQQRFSDAVAQYFQENPSSVFDNSVPKFASGGYHSGGMRLVGERGPELEITGPARYMSSAQTGSILSGESVEKLIVEITALRAQVIVMQEKLVTAVVEGAVLNTKATEENTEVISKTVKDTNSKKEHMNNIKGKVASL